MFRVNTVKISRVSSVRVKVLVRVSFSLGLMPSLDMTYSSVCMRVCADVEILFI